MSGDDSRVNGILLLYHRPLEVSASTIMEHVEAFERHSRFRVWKVNTALGPPQGLSSLDFATVVLHYSLFGPEYHLDQRFRSYLANSAAYKIAFFQDEYHYCQQRFAFLNQFAIDCVYTLLEPGWWDAVYRRYTSVPRLIYNIPGYVSDELVRVAAGLCKEDAERRIDVGYRGRSLASYMGEGAQEKATIGRRFLDLARGEGLTLDIAVDEDSRIYGDSWLDFLSDCRGVLGVEAGVSVFDTTDVVREQWESQIRAGEPSSTQAFEALLAESENNIYYRTISPRHFEAAALRVCQILYEGRYSGILEPMVHFIPLQKDFSNLSEVLERFRDPAVRRELTNNAHRDLIASNRYTYERFIAGFDRELISAGLVPDIDPERAREVTEVLGRDERRRENVFRLEAVGRRTFPGKRLLRPLLRPAMLRARAVHERWRYRRWEQRLTGRRADVQDRQRG
jgi:hypothetical protein